MAAVQKLRVSVSKNVAKKSTSKPPHILAKKARISPSVLSINGVNGSHTMSPPNLASTEDETDESEEVDNRRPPDLCLMESPTPKARHEPKARKSFPHSSTAQQQIAAIEKRQAEMMELTHNNSDTGSGSDSSARIGPRVDNTSPSPPGTGSDSSARIGPRVDNISPSPPDINGHSSGELVSTHARPGLDLSNDNAQSTPGARTSFKGILDTPALASESSDNDVIDIELEDKVLVEEAADSDRPKGALVLSSPNVDEAADSDSPKGALVLSSPNVAKSETMDSCDKEVQRTLAGGLQLNTDSSQSQGATDDDNEPITSGESSRHSASNGDVTHNNDDVIHATCDDNEQIATSESSRQSASNGDVMHNNDDVIHATCDDNDPITSGESSRQSASNGDVTHNNDDVMHATCDDNEPIATSESSLQSASNGDVTHNNDDVIHATCDDNEPIATSESSQQSASNGDVTHNNDDVIHATCGDNVTDNNDDADVIQLPKNTDDKKEKSTDCDSA